jgi:E3 ubiquitin-protein ligase mind-bomb
MSHSFYSLFDLKGVKVPPRSQSLDVRLIAKGIFKGAVVVRGADWDWGDQDGGSGGQGKVQEIKGWENESGRSVAAVAWLHNPHVANVYRVGHKGKVDLKYVHETKNGQYYKTHLPVLGEHIERLVPPLEISQFSVGDKVRVMSDIDLVKQLQEGHGGWNIRMADVLGKDGHVHRVTERGDVRVQFHIGDETNEDQSSSIAQQNRWTFHPGALSKMHSFTTGDQVIICADEQRLRQAQKGHGEWSHDMIGALGKQGRVLQVFIFIYFYF